MTHIKGGSVRLGISERERERETDCRTIALLMSETVCVII